MSDVRAVAAAIAGDYTPRTTWQCEECDEHHTSPKAAIYCADRDRAEDAEDLRFMRSSD